jgi:hypothetical protein
LLGHIIEKLFTARHDLDWLQQLDEFGVGMGKCLDAGCHRVAFIAWPENDRIRPMDE